MKKKTLLLLSLCAIPVAALWEGGRQTPGGKAATGIAYLLPEPTEDFAGLDVRDAQNRPINSPSSSQELVLLFRENLLNLRVFAAPHIMTSTFAWLDSISNLINKSILMRLSIVFGAIQETILPLTRRFVHNVHNLWITISVGLLAGSLLVSTFCLQRTPRQLHLRI